MDCRCQHILVQSDKIQNSSSTFEEEYVKLCRQIRVKVALRGHPTTHQVSLVDILHRIKEGWMSWYIKYYYTIQTDTTI